jgi:anti-sigma factor RsiW
VTAVDENDAGSMTCHELVEAITNYLEGALPEAERARLDHHLAICPGCQAYLEQMRVTIRLTGRLTEEALPLEGRDEILAAFTTWRARR